MARSIVSTQSIGLAAFSLLAIQLPLVNAVFLNSASDLPTNATPFDFIVVGSGPGGAVVASRLSENPQINVLLVEAGPSDEGVLEIEIPAFAATAPKTYEWNTTTVPVPSLNGRSVEFRRGHVLGGGSSINGLVYTRGSAELYDGWARMTGDNGWSWENIQRYIRKNEKWMHPNSRRNVSGEFNPAVHTFNGAVSASLGNEPDYLFDRLGLDSAKLQDEFTFNLDMNSGNALGLGFTQWTVGDGQRSSAATGYLNATVKARPNLTILVNTYVTRVLSDGTGKNIRKVEIGDRSTSTVDTVLSHNGWGKPK
ncbi:FAD/NAD(P)-binding domain-containing protein, partial [Coprinopsis marcescibilis]